MYGWVSLSKLPNGIPGLDLSGEDMQRIRRACKRLLLVREDFKSDKAEVLASGRCMLLEVSALLTELADELAGNGSIEAQSERRLYEFMSLKLSVANEVADSEEVGEVYALLCELRDVEGKGNLSAG
jgi:flagellin-specific chaperone FliS